MSKQKKTRPTIDISNSDDELWGQLSFLDESTPFECGGLLWPSIARYVFAQKFRGTPLVQKIQEAPSNVRALRLTKPIPYNVIHQDGRVETKFDYLVAGDIVPDTTRIIESINEAIKAKFVKEQQIQLLIRTYPAKFTSPFKIYAGLLGRYRDGLYISAKAPSVGHINSVSDIPESHIPISELFDVLSGYVKRIKSLEHISSDVEYLGMYDDAAFNMAPAKAVANIIRIPYGTIFKTQPRYSNIINQVTDFLAKKFPKSVKSTKEFAEVVSRVAAAFRWLLVDADFETSLRYRNVSTLSLRPVHRKYRKNRPAPIPPIPVRPAPTLLPVKKSSSSSHTKELKLPQTPILIGPGPSKAASTEEKSESLKIDLQVKEESTSETTEPNTDESSGSEDSIGSEEPTEEPIQKPKRAGNSKPQTPKSQGQEVVPGVGQSGSEKFGKKRKK